MLHQLFDEIEKDHSPKYAIDPFEIDALEKQVGHIFPEDLKEFYRRYESVRLFASEYGALYNFVPVRDIHPTRYDIYGKSAEKFLGPDNWLTICDILDGNYIAIDINSQNGNEWNFIDCFHETFARPGECLIIARTFTELLDRALHSGNDRLFYFIEGFQGYGDGMPLTAESASLRVEGHKAPHKGWIMNFTLNPSKSYREFFADDDYGGKEEALNAIRDFIEKCKRENG